MARECKARKIWEEHMRNSYFFEALTHQQPITKFVRGFQPTNLKAWLPTSEIEPMPTLQKRNGASGCYAKGSLCDTTKLMGCTVKIS